MKQKEIKENLFMISHRFAVWSTCLPIAQNTIKVECAQMILAVMELWNSTGKRREEGITVF